MVACVFALKGLGCMIGLALRKSTSRLEYRLLRHGFIEKDIDMRAGTGQYGTYSSKEISNIERIFIIKLEFISCDT